MFIQLTILISLGILCFAYIAYPIIIWSVCKILPRQRERDEELNDLPRVSLIVAAWNEKPWLQSKISNCLALDYPEELLQLIFVTDGSDDGSPEFLSKYRRILLFHNSERKGKSAAINRVMQFVDTPITVFTDANTFLHPDSIRQLVKHFAHPKIGCVSGEKRVQRLDADSGIAQGESTYWKYESHLKRLDGQLYSVTGAAGELLAIRTNLFERIPENTILDDLRISLQVLRSGYRISYEPRAYAIESASQSIQEEMKRKIRICSGGFQLMPFLVYFLNPLSFPIFSIQLFSRRIMRWTLAPLSLLALLVLLPYAAWKWTGVYLVLAVLQTLFYLLALWGWKDRKRKRKSRFYILPLYFTIMHTAVFIGFKDFILGKSSALWSKSERQQFSNL